MFYQRLKDLKEDKEMKQKDIAKIIDVSENQYGRYERGENDIPLEKALILANYYDVSLDYIVGKTNNKKGLNSTNLTKNENDVLFLFNQLTPKGKKYIIDFIKSFVDYDKIN